MPQTLNETTPLVPAPRVGADGRYGAMTAQVNTFITLLRRVPISAWCQSITEHGVASQWATAELVLSGEMPSRRATEGARVRLREILGTMPGVANRIRRRVGEIAAACEGIAPCESTAGMRLAAQVAAAAIAASTQLSPAEFDELYAPFQELIPLSRLGMQH